MKLTAQELIAQSIEKAALDLAAAIERLPEDKLTWSPLDRGRTALDQAAECALLNRYTTEMVEQRAWLMDFERYTVEKAALAVDWATTKAALEANTAKLVEVIRAIKDEDFDWSIDVFSRHMTMAQVLQYPFWNMSYHEGQINYIGFLLAE